MNDSSASLPESSRWGSKTPRWATWILPSTTEVCFLSMVLILLFGKPSQHFFIDGDPGWHIRAGQYMLETHSIPHHDIFSFTMPHGWWVTWEWGTEILYAILHRFFGLSGIVLFTVLILAGSYAALYWFLRRDGASYSLSFLLLLFVILGSSFHWVARPHVVSYLFVLLFYFLLDQFMQGRMAERKLWLLPLLMFIWVNLHAGFIAGLLLILTFLSSALLTRFFSSAPQRLSARSLLSPLGKVTAACFAATLINPNGYGLYVYIYRYFQTVHRLNPINELSSPSFQMVIFHPFLFAVIALIFLLRYSHYRLRLEEMLALTLWVGLALISLRNIPVMLFLCAPIYAHLIQGLRDPLVDLFHRSSPVTRVPQRLYDRIERTLSMDRNFRRPLLTVIVLIFLSWVVAHQGHWGKTQILDFQFREQYFPVGGAEYLRAHMPPGNVFNECLMGGYLIYNFFPKFKVFIDSRLDFYGEPFSREYVNVINTPDGGNGKPDWRSVFAKYRIQWTILRPDFPLRYALEADTSWTRTYQDAKCVIFVRNDVRLAY
jgi:hypothetical protein